MVPQLTVCIGFTLMKKNLFKCCVTWQLMAEAGPPFKGAWMALLTFMSTGNHTKKALEIWKASFGSETIIFTDWLHLLAWCFELIWRITKATDDLPSTRLSLWPTKAIIIGWQSVDTEAPQVTHCFRTRSLSSMSYRSFLYFALRMTCNIGVKLLPENLEIRWGLPEVDQGSPTLKLISFFLHMRNTNWSASSPIRYFNFQFIANQDCSFQQDDIKFLFAALLTKTNKCTLLNVPLSRTFLIGKSFYEHCWQLVLLGYFPPCDAGCTLLTMISC